MSASPPRTYPLWALLPRAGDVAVKPLPFVPIPRSRPAFIAQPRPEPQDILWDVGLMSDGFHTFLTSAELDLANEQDLIWQEFADRCAHCAQYVTLWGWGGYCYNPESSCLDRTSLLCKACAVFESCGLADAPTCTCPEGAVACAKTNSGCLLHTVLARTKVPPGVPRQLVPYTYCGTKADDPRRLFSPLDLAVLAWRRSVNSRAAVCPIKSWRVPGSNSRHRRASEVASEFAAEISKAELRAHRRRVEDDAARAEAEVLVLLFCLFGYLGISASGEENGISSKSGLQGHVLSGKKSPGKYPWP
ncbi:hypothetical protein FB451DRAFT_1175528 [Mycena latifolia]|nr:hypothetical protein FB451DRAFT_1175528 [Mycena latifolia]